MRIAINGFGRIGRGVLRALYESNYRQRLEIVAINELADLATIEHLLKYDSVHGRFSGEVRVQEQHLLISFTAQQNGLGEAVNDKIAIFHQQDLQRVDWQALNVDVLLECSGHVELEQLKPLQADYPAMRVLFSRPMLQHETDATIVYGVNHNNLKATDKLVSTASCTTNALVPVLYALDQRFGIESGCSTTLHSLMNDQPVLDAYHHTNLRKTRAASHSMIPVNTALAKGVERLLPHLQGRFSAQAVRVPTLNVSALDVSLLLSKAADVEAINACLHQASQDYPAHVLQYTQEPLASCDFNHCKDSAVVDAGQTRISGDNLAKVWVWFDNEWAYAHRMLDISEIMACQQQQASNQ